ncbi:MAG: hypothetical protein K5945_03785 [Bacteroidaceae bacterium]|nr:hypothetical protein [Bacteroidaceae bacterium]
MKTTKHLLLLAALSVLGAANSYADLTQVDGVYQIGTPADLVAFSALVNEGQTDANAVLLCDIGMSNTTGFNPIGTAEAPFKGTFDGKGHRIMNLQIIAGNYAGFIGCVVGGATIRNLILDETCSISGGKRVGLVGGSNGEGIVTMECLGNEATITGSGANAGGIFGGNTSSKSTIIIERCYNAGNVTGSKESGAISGWIGSSSLEHSLAYCYNIGTVTGYKDESQYVYRGSPAHIENIFSTLGTQGTIVSNEAVASGELTWLMNGQTFLNPKFFQTIGVDSKPLFDSTHEVVIKAGDAYSSFNPADGNSIKDACNFMIDEESQRAEETVASQALLDEYVALLQSWQGIETYEAFVTAYTNAQPLKQ